MSEFAYCWAEMGELVPATTITPYSKEEIKMHTAQFILLAQNQETGPSGLVLLIELILVVLAIAGLWATFAKAGKPGWAAIIPIYNALVLLQVAGRPWWWILLLLVPIVNIVIGVIVSIDVAKSEVRLE